MHGRFARYSFTGDPVDIARRAEEGVLPIFQAQTGFKSYSVFVSGEDILSFSAWETQEAAEAANAAVADWVAENLADRVQLKETMIGEILFATALGVSTMAGARA